LLKYFFWRHTGLKYQIRKNIQQEHQFIVILNMGLFGKKSEKEKLQKQYEKLMKQSFELSKSNRQASDQKAAEAEEIIKKIERLP